MLNLRLSRLLRRPLLRFSNGETDASISTSSSETPPSNHGPFREGVSHREDDHLSGEFTQLGFGKSPPLNVSEAESGEIRNPSFNSFDEIDELGGEEDDEDDEESVDERDDDDFAVLESFGKIPRSREDVNSRFDVEEDESRHPLVRETNRLINLRSSWNPKHEGEMRNLLRSLKPSQVCAVLRSQDDERVALKFFYWADRQWRYRHHPVVYYSMLEALSKTKLCQGARRVLVLMKRRGQLRDALKVLTLMQRAGVEPDLLVCNTAIDVFVRGNRLEKALRFLERMQVIGIVPDVVTYNCLIRGYCDLSRVEEAVELLEEMPNAALSLLDDMYLINKHADVFTYTTLVDALGKKGRIEEATKLTNKMLHKGIDPTPVTYRTVIHRYCQMGKVDDLVAILEKMLLRQKCRTVYNQVIEKLCGLGKLEEADKILGKVLRTASTSDAKTCYVLMEGYLKKGAPLSAYKVACRMFNRDLIPDVKMCEKLSKRLVLEGKVEEADQLMLRLVERGRISPIPLKQSMVS
ncbi:hypothetical protein HID58_034527 [Brassica napus]|uniref:Pentatricopeptide repeat-containing protein n=2 Tax=Brassica napus TaxID=3708 RepID=A0ABQ8C2B2_BRANA|nr:hypothetical protein HID58_034527 [Brassica napus]